MALSRHVKLKDVRLTAVFWLFIVMAFRDPSPNTVGGVPTRIHIPLIVPEPIITLPMLCVPFIMTVESLVNVIKMHNDLLNYMFPLPQKIMVTHF